MQLVAVLPVVDLVRTLPQLRIDRFQAVGGREAFSEFLRQAQTMKRQCFVQSLVQACNSGLIQQRELFLDR
jgi:hypothetical protein